MDISAFQLSLLLLLTYKFISLFKSICTVVTSR